MKEKNRFFIHLTAVFILFAFASCDPPPPEYSSGEDGTAYSKEEVAPEVLSRPADTIDISRLKSDLKESLKDSSIPQYYKNVYRQGKIITGNDQLMLSITERIFTAEPNQAYFYFLVFTKSMNGADGFYSEALGLAAMDFLRENTGAFASYFDGAPELTALDMKSWAHCVYGEMQISEEGNEEQAIYDLEKELMQNVKGSGKEGVIARFMAGIRAERIELTN